MPDMAEVILFIRSLHNAVRPCRKSFLPLHIVSAGVQENRSLPNSFHFFEKDTIETTQGQLAHQPLVVVYRKRAFQPLQLDRLGRRAIHNSLWQVHRRRRLIPRTTSI